MGVLMVSKYDRIYKGVERNPYHPDVYCECNLKPDGDTEQRCNNNARVELCDLQCQASSTGSRCITSCAGLPAGDYQSCHGCNVYASCDMAGNLYDERPCATDSLLWDDDVKRCEWESNTCTDGCSDEEVTAELVEQMVEPKIKSKGKGRRRRSDHLHLHGVKGQGQAAKSHAMGRSRRQEEEEEEDYDFDLSTPANLTGLESEFTCEDYSTSEECARQACEEYFDAAEAAKSCKENVNINTDDDVDGCITDLLVTSDTSWLVAGLEAIKEACSEEMSLNTDFAEDDDLHDLAGAIQAALCPDECSSNGECVEGACECDEPYTLADCSLDSLATPDFVEQFEQGLCDETARDCQVARMLGLNILPEVTCHLTQVQVDDTGVVVVGNEVSVEGTMRSINEAHCPLPDHSSYLITLSNSADGDQSNATVHVVYNSICHDCIADEDDPMATLCTRTLDSCVIGSECFLAQQTAPDDSCKICYPAVSDTQWQVNNIAECQGLSTWVIVGIAIAAVVVTAAIATIIVKWRAAKNSDKKCAPSQGYDNSHHDANSGDVTTAK